MRARLATIVLISSLATHSAYADSIPVTAGSFSESTSTVADFALSGSSFSLTGVGSVVIDVLQQCIVCTPGSDFSMSGWWDFEGVEETTNLPATGRLTFSSSVVTIPNLAENQGAVFQRLFTFAGEYSVPGTLPVQLEGRGIATLRFFRHEGEGVLPTLIRYDFTDTAPVPEPATMGLVGSGLVAAYLRRRRRPRSGSTTAASC